MHKKIYLHLIMINIKVWFHTLSLVENTELFSRNLRDTDIVANSNVNTEAMRAQSSKDISNAPCIEIYRIRRVFSYI